MSEVTFARTETGQPLNFDPLGGGHTLVTGQTGSGKSVTSQNILMAIANQPCAQAVVLDASGVLAAPWDRVASGSHVSGIGPDDVPRVIDVLTSVVAEMDRRTRALGKVGADKVEREWLTPEFPALWVVLEEYAGTLSVADRKQEAEITKLVGRLLREGRKAAISVLTIVQRPEAAVLHDRGQYQRLVLHLLENATTVKMVLDDPDDGVIRTLTTLAPGQFGYKVIGPKPLVRAKSYRYEYADYCTRVGEWARHTPPFVSGVTA